MATICISDLSFTKQMIPWDSPEMESATIHVKGQDYPYQIYTDKPEYKKASPNYTLSQTSSPWYSCTPYIYAEESDDYIMATSYLIKDDIGSAIGKHASIVIKKTAIISIEVRTNLLQKLLESGSSSKEKKKK